MANQFLEQFLNGSCDANAAPIEGDLGEIDQLYTEVAVLRDVNSALALERDRLLAERDELRSVLKLLLPQVEGDT